MQKIIELRDLPKISLNDWYSGTHWTKRVKIKNDYIFLIKSQYVDRFNKQGAYDVRYDFGFKKNPLDASNCIAMVKIIEDILFEDDSYKVVNSVTVLSKKSKEDIVKISIVCL